MQFFKFGNIIIIMYIYHALINFLSAHMIHINLNTVFYTHVEHSPTKTVYLRYYLETHARTHARRLNVAETDISWGGNPVRRGRF